MGLTEALEISAAAKSRIFIPWMVGLGIALTPACGAAGPPDLHVEHLSIEQGLSQNTVYAALQDSTGFLWFGTSDGLSRFDGYGFEVLRSDPSSPESLSNNRIRSLLEDRDGFLWVGTRNGGLNRYDRRTGRFTRFSHDPESPSSLAADLVWTMYQDSRGTLWIGTGGGGLDRLDPETRSFHHLRHDPEDPRSLSHDFVKEIHEDRRGRLWVATAGGLNRLNPDEETFERFFLEPPEGDAADSNTVSAIHGDGSGLLWLGTAGGLVRFDPETSAFTYYRHDANRLNRRDFDEIWDIYEDDDGALWLSTFGGGLLFFEPGAGTFSRLLHDDSDPASLSGNRLTVFLKDRSGAFWIGTSGAGLNKISRIGGAFGHYGRADAGLVDDMVMSVLEDRDGLTWIGTWNGGLHRLDRSSGELVHYAADRDDPTKLSRNDVRALLEDRHGDLWVGTEDGGLHRLDRATGRFTCFRHDPGDPGTLRDDDAWVLLEDRDGALWVGTYGGGLSRLESATGAFENFLHDAADPRSLASDVVRALHEDASGRLWVGTSDGLCRLDDRHAPPDKARFACFRHDQDDATSLRSSEVLSILEDRAGNLWLGTHGGGLNRLLPDGASGPTFQAYTTVDGLPSDVVYGILEDDRGALWMSTNRGLSRFDPVSETFRNYDTADGLNSNEFNSGAYFRTVNGEMLFGGLKGLTSFFPDRISGNTYVPPVVLTSFRKFNEEVAVDGDLATLSSVTLCPDETVFSFEFAALSFVAPRRNRYAYRLVGFRDEWIDLGTKRDVTFTNLSPGTYTLQVNASNGDGVWNDKGLELNVVVEPPFWRTTSFMTLAGLAVGLLVWGGHQARIRSVRRHNAELQVEISERRRVERERERLIGELEAKNRELESRNAEMERFTYTVSHDLKAPLITIQGFLGFLCRDIETGDAERVESDVARIREAADKMYALLHDLLELSRVGVHMNPAEPVALPELVDDALQQLITQLDDRGARVDVLPSMPRVYGDRVRLREVYENLIGNAIKFMGEQASPRVEVGARAENGQVLCWVRDNGIGIDPSYQERVFNLFERLDTQVDGTGVGLALVKRIVEVHGGRSWVESPGEGGGSTFFFTLPASNPPATNR